jgi:hypothetical protein
LVIIVDVLTEVMHGDEIQHPDPIIQLMVP